MEKPEFLERAIAALAAAYGPQGWWPLPSRALRGGRNAEGYLPGPSAIVGPGGGGRRALERFEIACAAILAQNTAWTGAGAALRALESARVLGPAPLLALGGERLEALIRPSGTFRLKARYLRALAQAWPDLDAGQPSRPALLALPGIGFETADCILVYCYGEPRFIADAYARRILSRLGILEDGLSYESARIEAEALSPRDPAWLAEAHALLVEHAKRHCRAKPLCAGCSLADVCLRMQTAEAQMRPPALAGTTIFFHSESGAKRRSHRGETGD